MRGSENQDATGIINAFYNRYLEDQGRGQLKSVEEYQREFTGYDELIARKYADLSAMMEEAPDAGGASSTDQTSAGEAETLEEAPFGAETAIDDYPRERIGPYRLLYTLGEGGMGSVYLADQIEPIRRRVALKRIKLGMDSKEVIARFEAERQALALMNHPAIAKVFDAGTTVEGQPYFVMEYVKGETITQFCDEQKLGTRERLELFVRLCDGIQHAHQKGIIHRDIKPSNVLVALDGDEVEPKIIDFGISKSLNQPLTDRTAFTQHGQLIGTPSYTSPEQAEVGALDIDTRSDIYSLGVLLYELITGTLPLDPRTLGGIGYAELQRRIVEDEPPKPSTRFEKLGDESLELAQKRGIDHRSLLRELKGDLDWIVMKALEKERTRRYGTASEFAEDVRRHLRHEPVVARPPSTTYRIQKFMRKRRVPLLVAATVLLLFGVYAYATSLLEQRERDHRSREAFANGEKLWEEYQRGQNERLKQAQDRLNEERDVLESWWPIWRREKELEYWAKLRSERTAVTSLYNQAQLELYNAYDLSSPGSPRRQEMRGRVLRSMWPTQRYFESKSTLRQSFGVFAKSAFEIDESKLHQPQTVRFQTDPSGSTAYCFRYEMVEGRLFPLPYNVAEQKVVGEPFLKVEWQHGAKSEVFRPGDRIIESNGKKVSLLKDFLASLDSVGEGESISVLVERAGVPTTLSWVPFRNSVRPRVIDSIRGQFEMSFAGYPLRFDERCRAGKTPFEGTLPEGSYLFVFRREGYADVRWPVSVPLPPEAREDGEPIRLLKPDEIPPGYVYIPAGRFFAGGDATGATNALTRGHRYVPRFFIARHEVTIEEYLRFMNARAGEDGRTTPENPWVIQQAQSLMERQETRPKPPSKREALVFEGRLWIEPRHIYANSKLLTFTKGRGWWRKSDQPLDVPMVSVNLLAAAEYAHWRTTTDPEWSYRLPNDLQWEKSARGVDGRTFVWGEYHTWSFCCSQLGFSPLERKSPQSVGAFPFDESVYAVRDLGGSVSELTMSPVVTGSSQYTFRGGSWFATDRFFFRTDNRNTGPVTRQRGVDTGIRLVAERKKR
ncbi:MAG: protein kinase [Planctomycetota bacterium]